MSYENNNRLIRLLSQYYDSKQGNEALVYGTMSTREFVEFTDVANYLADNNVFALPCKIGDRVYVKYYGEIASASVTEFEINSKGIVVKVYIDPDTDREYDVEDIFLTPEEAEKSIGVKYDDTY